MKSTNRVRKWRLKNPDRAKEHSKKQLVDDVKTGYFNFRKMKRNAESRGLIADITYEQYKNIISGAHCHYCGTSKLPTYGCRLDRKDSYKGYTIDNVVPCCTDCNTMKSHLLSYEEMMNIWRVRRGEAIITLRVPA